MKILVACEFSGIVREAFAARGHDVVSCDLLPSELPGNHIVGNVLSMLADGWDMMIAHPPCTYLAVSGARWWTARKKEQEEALSFVRELLSAPIPRICLENPVGAISSHIRRPTQIITPTMFGDKRPKRTCLWLKGLPPLQGTALVEGEYDLLSSGRRLPSWYNLPPSINRRHERSRTFPAVAEAMAQQWGIEWMKEEEK